MLLKILDKYRTISYIEVIMKKIKKLADMAAEQGMLPHEFLLKIALGEPFMQKMAIPTKDKETGEILSQRIVEFLYIAPPDVRISCAKFAAPFFAPKLASQTVSVDTSKNTSGVMIVPIKASASEWEGDFAAQQARYLQ